MIKYIVGYKDTDTHAISVLYTMLNIEMEKGFSIFSNLPYKLKESKDITDLINLAYTLDKKLIEVKIIDNLNCEYDYKNGIDIENKYTVKCPTCSSNNVSRISTAEKVFGIAMFGLFSNKRKCTFHCNNCKYTW